MNWHFKKALWIILCFAAFEVRAAKSVCASGVAESGISSASVRNFSEADMRKFLAHGFAPEKVRYEHVRHSGLELKYVLEEWADQIQTSAEDRKLKELAAFRTFAANEALLRVLSEKTKPQNFFRLADFAEEGAMHSAVRSGVFAHVFWGNFGLGTERPRLESPERPVYRNKAHGAIEVVGALGRMNRAGLRPSAEDKRTKVEIRYLQIPPTAFQKTGTHFLWLVQPENANEKHSDLLISISDQPISEKPSPEDPFLLGTVVTPSQLWAQYATLAPKSP